MDFRFEAATSNRRHGWKGQLRTKTSCLRYIVAPVGLLGVIILFWRALFSNHDCSVLMMSGPPQHTYTIVRHHDVDGEDLMHVQAQNLEEVKKVCDLFPNCAGFNSNGWLKTKVSNHASGPADLYVKSESKSGHQVIQSPQVPVKSFSKSHEEVLSNMKIYVYEVTSGTNHLRHRSYGHDVEQIISNELARSPLRTRKPDEATFFYIPIRCSYFINGFSSEEQGILMAKQHVAEFYELMERQMPLGGWKELESDPGLFTLLVRDFGVKGVQVEEVYDLQRPLSGKVYGFIFLFKWSEVGRCRRKAQFGQDEPFCTDVDTVNGMFFAHQLIPNSCATHALLSILLNCKGVDLGGIITRLKDTCKLFDPETKGFAIANMPELFHIHNKHAHPEMNPLSDSMRDKPNGITPSARTVEAFHYTCYLPMNNHLFELDGLKPHPIDHGPVHDSGSWHDMARRVINDRISAATGGEQCHDIRYNLMAVVPSKIDLYEVNLKALMNNHKLLGNTIEQALPSLRMDENEQNELRDILRHTRENVAECMTVARHGTNSSAFCTTPDNKSYTQPNPGCVETCSLGQINLDATNHHSLQDIKNLIKEKKLQSTMQLDDFETDKTLEVHSMRDVQRVLHNLETTIKHCKLSLQEEHDKVRKYEIDAARRTHSYDPFIRMFLAMLAERGMLTSLIDDNLIVKRKMTTSKVFKKPDKKKRKRK